MTRTFWIYYHLFLTMVAAANIAIDLFGAATIGALIVPWGTFFAGATFVLRDMLHQRGGHVAALSAIAVGAVISYGLTNAALAVASGAAFLIAEIVDLLVFVRIAKQFTFAAAVLVSGVAGVIVDTFVFLPWSGIPMTLSLVAGQLIIKSSMSAVAAGLLYWRRKPVTA